MDETHEEFYRVAFDLLTCTDENALKAVVLFEQHAIEHFGQEDEWMRSSEFPARNCHVGEHAAVLASVKKVRDEWEAGTGDVRTVHYLATCLYDWFPGHADYLDSALAAWMTKRKTGGKPVVLRRSIRSSVG